MVNSNAWRLMYAYVLILKRECHFINVFGLVNISTWDFFVCYVDQTKGMFATSILDRVEGGHNSQVQLETTRSNKLALVQFASAQLGIDGR